MTTDNTPENNPGIANNEIKPLAAPKIVSNNNKPCFSVQEDYAAKTVTEESPKFSTYLVWAIIGYALIVVPAVKSSLKTTLILTVSIVVSVLVTMFFARGTKSWGFAFVRAALAHVIIMPIALVVSVLILCAAH